MSQPYDVVTKRLIDGHPADWLMFLGVPNADAEPLDVDIVDSDLSTVSSQADRILKLNGPDPSLQHIELETGHRGAESPGRLLRYSVLVSGKYNLPVESTIILLRPEADSPALTGRLELQRQDGTVYLSFEYNVVRVWQLSAESLLSGGIGTLPLAALADVTVDEMPEVVRRMQERLSSEATTDAEVAEFWTSTNVLLGMRYSEAQVVELLKGVTGMRESVTYQAIVEEGRVAGLAEGLAEGRAEEARAVILRLGSKRFDDPSATVRGTIDSLSSLGRLEQLVDRLLEVESWDELMATP